MCFEQALQPCSLASDGGAELDITAQIMELKKKKEINPATKMIERERKHGDWSSKGPVTSRWLLKIHTVYRRQRLFLTFWCGCTAAAAPQRFGEQHFRCTQYGGRTTFRGCLGSGLTHGSPTTGKPRNSKEGSSNVLVATDHQRSASRNPPPRHPSITTRPLPDWTKAGGPGQRAESGI